MSAILDNPLISVVLPFLLVLGIVVFIHEYGHYIVGRWCGIHAEEFSLGFGPEVFGWNDRHGTRWKLSWVPLGGYVRFRGDADAASTPDADAARALSDEERRATLNGAPLWARSATVAAGPAANFILTILIFAGIALALGRPSDDPVIAMVEPAGQAAGAGLQAGDRLLSIDGAPVDSFSGFIGAMLAEEGRPRTVAIERGGDEIALDFALTRPPVIEAVAPDGAAARACLAPGDVILAIDDQPIASFSDLQAAVRASDEETATFKIQRGPELLDVALAPERTEYIDPVTGAVEQRVMIGVIGRDTLGLEPSNQSVGPIEAVEMGVAGLGRIVFSTLGYLNAWITGAADGSAIGGPIGIARASGQTAEAGLLTFIAFVGTVSAAIGFINLFPIPMLDGGHLVFYALEGIRGRPLSERWVEACFKVGLAAILTLVVFATYNDVAKVVVGATASC